jgi:hypothetical protein
MATEPKTRPTDADVTDYLESVPDARRRDEGHRIRELMERVTGEKAVMWGPSIVGFGSVPYTNTTGTYDWPIVGFSPRKTALTFYGLHNAYEPDDPLLAELGPHTTGVGCLYVKKLDAVDLDVLEKLVAQGWERA